MRTIPRAEKGRIRTLPAGNGRGGAGLPRGREPRGFTLLELLVVLVLIGVLTAAVAPTFLRDFNADAEFAATQVAAALRTARGRAISENAETVMAVDIANNRYVVSGQPASQLPEDLTIGLFTARSELFDDAAGQIRYFPDGSSTGGEVVVSDGRSTFRVRVEWLTGRVTVLQDTSG